MTINTVCTAEMKTDDGRVICREGDRVVIMRAANDADDGYYDLWNEETGEVWSCTSLDLSGHFAGLSL